MAPELVTSFDRSLARDASPADFMVFQWGVAKGFSLLPPWGYHVGVGLVWGRDRCVASRLIIRSSQILGSVFSS